jgi:hypothetical protein
VLTLVSVGNAFTVNVVGDDGGVVTELTPVATKPVDGFDVTFPAAFCAIT